MQQKTRKIYPSPQKGATSKTHSDFGMDPTTYMLAIKVPHLGYEEELEDNNYEYVVGSTAVGCWI